MVYIPMFIPVYITPIKKSELENNLEKTNKTIKINYSLITVIYSLLLLFFIVYLLPLFLDVTYTTKNLSAPTYPMLICIFGVISNVYLFIKIHTMPNLLNNDIVTNLQNSSDENIYIPPYEIVNKSLMKINLVNIIITLLAILFSMFLPMLLHPNFPNI